MTYPTHLLPTTVVGSYPQPDWLVDRAGLHAHGVQPGEGLGPGGCPKSWIKSDI